MSKRKLRELLASIDDDDRLTDEAEDLLQDVADDFLNSITTFACQLAKHRKSERLEVKDIAFHLGKLRAFPSLRRPRCSASVRRILKADSFP